MHPLWGRMSRCGTAMCAGNAGRLNRAVLSSYQTQEVPTVTLMNRKHFQQMLKHRKRNDVKPCKPVVKHMWLRSELSKSKSILTIVVKI